MSNEAAPMPNVKQAVPFFAVSNMAASTRYYVDSLGFTITQRWTDDYFLTMAQLVQCYGNSDKLDNYGNITANHGDLRIFCLETIR